MGKFQRINDVNIQAGTVNRQFGESVRTANDFSALEAETLARRAAMAREAADYNRQSARDAEAEPKSWERIPTAAVYQHPKGVDELGSAIRRVMSDTETDQGARANPADWGFFSPEECMMMKSASRDGIYPRGGSIMNPDMHEIQAQLHAFAERDGMLEEHSLSPEQKRAQLHQEWQADRGGSVVRQRNTVTARANPMLLNRAKTGVTRIGEEHVAASSFGTTDFDYLMQEEKNRAERHSEAREASARIKRSDRKSVAQRHDEWEHDAPIRSRSQSYQSQDANWTDSYIRNLGG